VKQGSKRLLVPWEERIVICVPDRCGLRPCEAERRRKPESEQEGRKNMEESPKEKETLQEWIRRRGLKPSSLRHPDTRSEVIVFLGRKVGPGRLKEYREARETREAKDKAEAKTGEPNPPEDQE